jgi:hypothetical protein
MSIGHWPFPAAILCGSLFRHTPKTSPRRPRWSSGLPVSVIRLRIGCSTSTSAASDAIQSGLAVKYCLRPPKPTTAIAINARVEPGSGTDCGVDGGVLAVTLPIRFAQAV